ncbi:MAG: NTP transferase domain-containing protein [Leadbetterella sp.]
MKHTKHAKLTRPTMGKFGRNEIAFLGTSCEDLADFWAKLLPFIPKSIIPLLIDADHSKEKDPLITNRYQDKIDYKQFSTQTPGKITEKMQIQGSDLIWINGNHFEGQKQILFLNPKKEESLKKRTDQISEPIAIIQYQEDQEIYPWLKDLLPNNNIPSFFISDYKEIADFVLESFKTPNLNALILTGGKSQRMGEDKSQINYYGIPQVEFLQNQFKEVGINTFVSAADKSEDNTIISDRFLELGPYGGLLSALMYDPDSAWLVIACDLPLVTKNEIQELINKRNPYKVATACYNPETGFPDPLFTIWEPKSYPILLQYLSLGYSCPRKVLINEDIELIHLQNPEIIKNINTPEEKMWVVERLKH